MRRVLLLVWQMCALAGCERARASDPLEIVVEANAPSRAISPYVYGINGIEHTRGMEGVITLVRFGGTRTSTYNWENNASNAGHDPPRNQNDGFLSPSTEPGAAVIAVLDRARELGAAALVTVPMIGRVAADRRADGDVSRSRNYLSTRFVRSRARGGALHLDDRMVYQDAFVRFVRDAARERGVRVFFALDNEPASWPVTEPLLRAGRPLLYREIVERGAEYARMIHAEAPDARVFGPVSFGWPEMKNLAGAPDADGRDFLPFYLDQMRARRNGARLLDVLDVHWYPDVRIEGRITSGADDPELARLRMQLPRSLYDPSYREPSWIADDVGAPIELLPRLAAIAREHDRGVRIGLTEYAYGGAAQPSGAVAEADALGAFGRYGVFAAAYWPLSDQAQGAALAAFRMFRRIDGDISFGDRSIPAISNDMARISAWASRDTRHPDRIVLVLVGRSDRPQSVRLVLRDARTRVARRFVLDGETRRELAPLAPSGDRYRVPIPPRSVTTLVIE
jgi:hypothetical protein